MHLSVFKTHTIPIILAFNTLLVHGDDCIKGLNISLPSNIAWPDMWRLPSDDPDYPQELNQFQVNDAVSANVLASAGVMYKFINPGNYT